MIKYTQYRPIYIARCYCYVSALGKANEKNIYKNLFGFHMFYTQAYTSSYVKRHMEKIIIIIITLNYFRCVKTR